jgi:hypothetical protein
MFLPATGNEPFLRAGFHVVTADTAVAEDDEFGAFTVLPNHRGRPATAVKGAWDFPGDFTVGFVAGDNFGLA